MPIRGDLACPQCHFGQGPGLLPSCVDRSHLGGGVPDGDRILKDGPHWGEDSEVGAFDTAFPPLQNLQDDARTGMASLQSLRDLAEAGPHLPYVGAPSRELGAGFARDLAESLENLVAGPGKIGVEDEE